MRWLLVALLGNGVVAAAAPDLPQVEALVARETNEFRAGQGLAALAPDAALERAARDFAAYMARTDSYGHAADGSQPSDRARAHGYVHCRVAENISYQQSSAPFATAELAQRYVEGWKESPGHRRNLLDPALTDMAVAVAQSPGSGRYYAVQLFGRPRSRSIEFRVTSEARSAFDYRVGATAFHIRPGEVRVHTLCAPEDVSFSAGGRGRTIRPSAGDNLIVTGDVRPVIRVER